MTTKNNAIQRYFTAVFLSTFALTEAATAQTETGNSTENWQFEFTPYVFGASLNGTVGIASVTADVDMGFDDILENLDSGFMAMFEAHKGAWSFTVDGVYFKIEDQRTNSWQGPLDKSGTSQLDATITEQVYQLTTAYRILDEKAKVDVLGVARYTSLDTKLNLAVETGLKLLPDGSNQIKSSKNWWDPAVGARVLMPLSKSWTLIGYTDIGGFGIGSDLTYQLLAGVNWEFTEDVTAKVGYRYLYQDFEDDGFTWDMTSDGAYLGIGFQF